MYTREEWYVEIGLSVQNGYLAMISQKLRKRFKLYFTQMWITKWKWVGYNSGMYLNGLGYTLMSKVNASEVHKYLLLRPTGDISGSSIFSLRLWFPINDTNQLEQIRKLIWVYRDCKCQAVILHCHYIDPPIVPLNPTDPGANHFQHSQLIIKI